VLPCRFAEILDRAQWRSQELPPENAGVKRLAVVVRVMTNAERPDDVRSTDFGSRIKRSRTTKQSRTALSARTRRGFLAALGVAGVGSLAGCLESTDGGPYGGYLAAANEFEETVDHTGNSEVTVNVGGGSGLAFVPAAVEVSPGTTVVWEWTGRGGRHNVVDEDGAFESEYYVSEGQTFEHTFEDSGVVKYYCAPHKSSGMLGVVEVVEQ
jgi:halocyanin-like protein